MVLYRHIPPDNLYGFGRRTINRKIEKSFFCLWKLSILFWLIGLGTVWGQNPISGPNENILNVNGTSLSDSNIDPIMSYGQLGSGPSPGLLSEGEEAVLANGYQVHENGKQIFYTPQTPASTQPISIIAAYGWKGSAPEDGEVYILGGGCQFSQGADRVEGPKAVVWIHRKLEGSTENRVDVYLEKEGADKTFTIEINSVFVEARSNDLYWYGTFRTTDNLNLHIEEPGTSQFNPEHLFYRGEQVRIESHVGVDTYQVTPTSRLTEESSSEKDANPLAKAPFRRFRVFSRHDSSMSLTMQSDLSNSSKRFCMINNGITIVIEGINSNGKMLSDVIDISADRAVIWADGVEYMTSGAEIKQMADLDLQLYLEGDIIFREGDRIIYAKNMYYDVKNKIGLIEDTEMVVPIPDMVNGFFRLKADRIEQRGPNSLLATNTWVTTSMMGAPSYRLQSNNLHAESRKVPLYDSTTMQPLKDPETGMLLTKDEQFLIAENNFVAFESVPIFYWPWMAMDTRDQTLYLRNLKVGSDSIFGTQVRTTWNMYQLLNMSKCRPEGTDWDLNLDYLSKRGLGHGMNFLYNRDTLFGCHSRAFGMMNFYGISDSGTDNLGLERRNLPFPNSYRYRGIWKHRQMIDLPSCFGFLSPNWILSGQFGTSSDRNYIPQYFEQEWFTNPNPETSLDFRKTEDNWSFAISGNYRMDDFYTQTNALPRLDHFWLGKPLFCDRVIWYEHTKLAYNQFRTTNSPYALADEGLFRYLDWELASDSTSNEPYNSGTKTLSKDSVNFSTRHELDLPLQAGPIKVVPYVLGEYAFWGKGQNENDISRVYGRGGVRVNLPMWKVDSDVSSDTFYLNGIAHKMNFVMDASYSGVNRRMEDLVQYEALDDWQIEDFRRRYSVTTFENWGAGGFTDVIPIQYDERYYALRQGRLAGSVTSPSTEIADDQTLIRFEWQNRWQTKRGPVGKRHTIDWITFNTGFNIYPKDDEDYGKYIGLIDYDFRWHVGDRFSVLSSGLYDTFDDGQRITRVGVMARRPWLGNIYLGVDRLAGPINSTYLNASLGYRMSEKWATTISTSYDLAQTENVGQNASISRIGESFVFTLSGNVNTSKDNWGVSLSVIPVFLLNRKKMEEGLLDMKSL